MSSPDKKRLRDSEDPESGSPTKRQKVDEEGRAINTNNSANKKKIVDDGSSDEFDPQGKEGSDSFDDDFDDPEQEAHGDDEGFDLEAYKKWREQHPDQDEPDFYGDECGEDDMEEGELEQDSEEEEKE